MNKRNKAHYDWAGDPLPEIRDALAVELMKQIPRDRFRPQFAKVYDNTGIWLFKTLADDVLAACPENVTLSVNEGNITFTREEIKRDPYAALAGDALAEYNKDQGPADLQDLFKRGLESSSFKQLLQ